MIGELKIAIQLCDLRCEFDLMVRNAMMRQVDPVKGTFELVCGEQNRRSMAEIERLIAADDDSQ